MTDIDQAAALALREPRDRSPLLKWAIIGVVVLVLLGAVGAAWWFMLGGREHFSPRHPKAVEAPLPFYLEMKSFVVSMQDGNGNSHFVQLGVSLQLSRSAAGEMATALLPEIQDTMRQTLLTFKSEDLQNPDGVDRVRKILVQRLNELLAKLLGPDRMEKLTEGAPNGVIVQNVLFPALIVE